MTTRFTVSTDVCSSSTKDGSIVLDVEKGLLYSIIGVGSLIWTKLADRPEGLTLNDLVESIRADFQDVPHQQIVRDAEKLLNQLHKEGIVATSDRRTDGIAETMQTSFDAVVQLLAHTMVITLLKLRLGSVAAFLQLGLIDLMLKTAGFRSMHRLVKCWPTADKKDVKAHVVREVCQAIDRAATYYPSQALCLHRSVVTTCFLRSHGVPAQMVIACRKMPFKGHAWVEVAGDVVNDNQKVQGLYSCVLEAC